MELTAYGEGILTEGNGLRISLDPLIQNDAYDTIDSYRGSCHPKSARTTYNIAVRAGLVRTTKL